MNAEAPRATTFSYAAAEKLHRDIVSGALAPATKLKIRELTSRYQLGASPIREALSRLAAQGFVQQEGQKGFRVSPVSANELLDITESRRIIEGEAIRHALRNANPAWEDEILTSFHLFTREVVRYYDEGIRRLDIYEERHHQFHRALISACPLRALREFCDHLYVRTTRYRMLTRKFPFTKDEVIGEHKMLMDAVLSGDEDAAIKAARSHIAITAEITLASLNNQEARPKREAL